MLEQDNFGKEEGKKDYSIECTINNLKSPSPKI